MIGGRGRVMALSKALGPSTNPGVNVTSFDIVSNHSLCMVLVRGKFETKADTVML